MDKNILYGIGSLVFGFLVLPFLWLSANEGQIGVARILMLLSPIIAILLGVFSIKQKKLAALGIIGVILGSLVYVIFAISIFLLYSESFNCPF